MSWSCSFLPGVGQRILAKWTQASDEKTPWIDKVRCFKYIHITYIWSVLTDHCFTHMYIYIHIKLCIIGSLHMIVSCNERIAISNSCGIYVSFQSGWWFGTFFIFPYIGNKSSQLTNIFHRGSNHQPATLSRWCFPNVTRIVGTEAGAGGLSHHSATCVFAQREEHWGAKLGSGASGVSESWLSYGCDLFTQLWGCPKFFGAPPQKMVIFPYGDFSWHESIDHPIGPVW